MTTRRAFLAGVGAAASGLVLPGIGKACGRRRRCRNSCQPCEPVPHRVVASFSKGCPMSPAGSLNGKYFYYCHCCGADSDNPWQYCTLGDSRTHSVGSGRCSGSDCDSITLPTTYHRAYGSNSVHYSEDCVNSGITDYIDKNEKFKAEPNVLALDVGSTNYNDGKKPRWAKLFVVVMPVQDPEPGSVTLLIGQELKPETQLAMHWAGSIKHADRHYHLVEVNGLQYHILTRDSRAAK